MINLTSVSAMPSNTPSMVRVCLSVPSNPDILAVGDTAAVTDQPGIPGRLLMGLVRQLTGLRPPPGRPQTHWI